LERLSSKSTPTTTESSTSSLWMVDAQDLRDVKLLGVGSFGSVVETEWLGQKHAKKVFSDARHQSFKTESEVLAGLSHPHLLRIVGSSVNGTQNLKYALGMELMQEDLSDFLKATMVTSLTALDLMLQVARGLKYLHSRRIVHRDLKSANILVASLTGAPELGPCLNAKLADFGLSKTKNYSTSSQTLDQGTRQWMAPELFSIQDEIDNGSMERPGPRAHPFKADVYSFAIVCSEILTKKEPFADVRRGDLLNHIRGGLRPELPDGCPRRLASLIKRCWEFEPLSRPDFPDICRELRYIQGLLLTGDKRQDEEVRFSTGPIKVQGTWGGVGNPFCDGVATGIKGFRITSKDGLIRSLEVEYDICSQSRISRHGAYNVGIVEEVRFACYISMKLHLVLVMANTNY
jgi:serine/threonine protein kinase